MTKRILVFALLIVLAVGVIPAQAVEPTAGVFNMARYIPAGADGFLAIRTDDDFLASVDVLLGKTSAMLADVGVVTPGIPSIRGFLASGLSLTPQDVDDIFAWLGDTIAVGVTQPPNGGPALTLAVVPVTDAVAARAYVAKHLTPADVPLGRMGRFDVYDDGLTNYLLLADDLLMIANNIGRQELNVISAENFPRLSGVSEYVAAVGALPSENYVVGVFVTAEAFQDTQLATTTEGGVFAAGLTIVDESTYAFDMAGVSPTPVMQPLSINSEFARYIPSNMGLVVHGADLAALVNASLTVAEQTSGNPVRSAAANVFAIAGTDIAEFYSWTKGDFALFGRLELRAILPSIMGNPPNVRGLPAALDFGMVIEAVKPDKARAFADSLSAVVHAAAGQAGITVSDETVNGTPVTVLIFESVLDDGSTVTFELAIGASDEVFAVGTASAVRAVFNSAPSVLDNPAYTDMARYWLTEPTTVWTINGSTAVNFAVFAYLLLAPSIGGAENPSSDQLGLLMDRISRFVRHATLSTAVNEDGVTLFRATITLGE